MARELSRQALGHVLEGVAQVHAGEVRMAEGLIELARHYSVTQDMLGIHLVEKAMPFGGLGTPELSEFLALEVGAALGLSETAAAHVLRSVLNLHYRHPRLWDAFRAGKIRRWEADKLTELCADLSPEAADWVDRRVALKVGSVSFAHLRKLTAGWTAQADPALAAAKEEAHRRSREVHLYDHAHGSSTIIGRIATTDAQALERAIQEIAHRLAEAGDERGYDQRRAAALGLLAEPAQAALWLTGEQLETPAIKRRSIVYVHLAANTLVDPCSGVARIEGLGPLTTETLPEFLRGTHITVRPVLDVVSLASTDRYEIPDQIRDAVHLRHPVEIFPFSARESRGLDLDHTRPYRQGDRGQTGVHNLGPLSRRAHRAKTMGAWKLTRLGTHCFGWISPLGLEYHAGPAGTHLIPVETHHITGPP